MSSILKKRKAILVPAAAVLFLLACEWFFFRQIYGSDRLFGDLGDGRLTTLIAEHWYHVFRGEASVGALGMFWPETNTLAYSDMLLGFGLVHSLLRFLGLNVYVAYKYTILLVHAFGTLCCFYLLWKVLGVRIYWALFGTIAFSFADTAVMGLLHTQLAAAWMLPLFGIFAVRFFQNLHDRKKRNLYAFAAILQIVLVLYTAWYMAFFTAFFVCTLAVVVLVLLLVRKAAKKEIGGFFRTVGWDLAGYILFGIVLVIPFVLLELPVLKESGGFGYSEAVKGLPQISDLVHVTHTNWLLGGWFGNHPVMGGRSHEVIRGYSFVLLAVFVSVFVLEAIEYRKGKKNGSQDKGDPSTPLRSARDDNDPLRRGRSLDSTKESHAHRGRCAASRTARDMLRDDTGRGLNRTLICFAVAVAVILDLLVMVRTEGGFSLWKAVFKFFPGGKSIRAVGRLMLFLSLPLSLVTAVMASDCGRKSGSGQRKGNKALAGVLAVCLLGCLLVSNVNTSSAGKWTEGEALARIRRVETPPEDCEVFYITHPDPGEILPLQQTEAWEIADALGVKTINGYSGQTPPNWFGIWNIDGDGYQNAVRTWIEEKGLKGVYEYNQEENQWNKVK